jgi:hypothetical protein
MLLTLGVPQLGFFSMLSVPFLTYFMGLDPKGTILKLLLKKPEPQNE